MTTPKKPQTLTDWLVAYEERNRNTYVNWTLYGREIAEATLKATLFPTLEELLEDPGAYSREELLDKIAIIEERRGRWLSEKP